MIDIIRESELKDNRKIKWRSTVAELRMWLDRGYFNESFYERISVFNDNEIIVMVV
jgi:hypothetical protein